MGMDLTGAKDDAPKAKMEKESFVDGKKRERWYDTDGKFVYKYHYTMVNTEQVIKSNAKPVYKYILTGKWTITDFKAGKVDYDGITRPNLKEIIKELKI